MTFRRGTKKIKCPSCGDDVLPIHVINEYGICLNCVVRKLKRERS